MSRRWYGIGLLTGLVLAAASVITANALRDSPRDGSLTLGLQIEGVCGGLGEQMELDQAAEKARFDPLIPNHERASRDNMTSAWLCPGDYDLGNRADSIVLTFDNGVEVHLIPNDLKDPAATWSALAASEKESTVGSVRGIVALLTEPSNAEGVPLKLQAEGGVQFVEGGLKVIVRGNHEIPLADLVAIAESLKPHHSTA